MKHFFTTFLAVTIVVLGFVFPRAGHAESRSHAIAKLTQLKIPATLDIAKAEVHRAILRGKRPWKCSEAVTRQYKDSTQKDDLWKEHLLEAAKEWRSSRMLRARIGKDLGYYQKIRWRYLQTGVCDVPHFITEVITQTKFLGQLVWLQRTELPALKAAEKEIRRHGIKRLSRIGTFSARTLKGPYGRLPWLSNHALGLAIDLDPHKNPYLSVDELQVIETISGVRLNRWADTPPGERWESFKEAQVQYKANYRYWLKASKARMAELEPRIAGDPHAALEYEQLERTWSILKRSNAHRMLKKRGILTLPKVVVETLHKHGFIWSTDYRTGADMMHFEVRDPR